MARAIAAAVAAVVLTVSCFGPDPEVTASGKGLPQLSIEFPQTSEPGSTHTATLTVENPGPQPMTSVVVAFLRVGPAQGGQLPEPIVDGAAKHKNPAILGIEPKPEAISQAAVVFTFDGLREGESTTIAFRLKVPGTLGEAANSVTVYDGSDPTRARGVRLQTTVQP
jgi:hypothetical protein